MPACREQLELRADPGELAIARRFVDAAAARFGLEDRQRYEFTFAPARPAIGRLHERGRGLAFMAATVDEVDVRRGSKGTVVRLCKRRAAA